MSTSSSAADTGSASRALRLMPGVSFGPFKIGDSVVAVAETLRLEASRFGHVEVDVDIAQPVGKPVTMSLPKIATALRFSPRTQVLESITVQQLHQCGEVLYKGKVFCSGRAMPATLARIYDVLGPTFQGDMRSTGCYVLRYPGIEIAFDIPAKYRHEFARDGSGLSDTERTADDGCSSGCHPVVFSDGTTPVATFLVVEPASGAGVPSLGPLARAPLDCAVNVVATAAGAAFGEGRLLCFGCSPQDAVALLGTPRGVCVKKDDRLLIHNPAQNARNTSAAMLPSYFYTYPHLGVDLAFDGVSHTLQKIVCFNAVPPDETFLRYHRCHFAVDAAMLVPHGLDADVVLTGNTQWGAVEKVLLRNKCAIPKPLLATTRNGVVRIFSFVGVVIDVLSTGIIAKVTLLCAKLSGSPPGYSGVALPGRSPLLSKGSSPAATISRQDSEPRGASPASDPTYPNPSPSSEQSESSPSLHVAAERSPQMPAVAYPSPSAFAAFDVPAHSTAAAANDEDDALERPDSTSPMRVQHTAQLASSVDRFEAAPGCSHQSSVPRLLTESGSSNNVFADEERAAGGQHPQSRQGFLQVDEEEDAAFAGPSQPHTDDAGALDLDALDFAALVPPPHRAQYGGYGDSGDAEEEAARTDNCTPPETQSEPNAAGARGMAAGTPKVVQPVGWSTVSNSGSSKGSKKSKKGKKR